MEVAKVTSKGQITIPISIRRKLEINEGDKVLFIYKDEGVMMVNPNMLRGGVSGDVVEAAETEMAAEAIAAVEERSAANALPETAPQTLTSTPASTPIVAPTSTPAVAPTAQKPIPEEVPHKPEPTPSQPSVPEPSPAEKIGGFDLNTLMDDLRSIGSVQSIQ